MKDNAKLIICFLFLILTVILLSISSAYAENSFSWWINTGSTSLASDSEFAGGDDYAVNLMFYPYDDTAPCAFRAVAFYNDKDVLIALSVSENTAKGEEVFKVKSTQEPSYYKVFAWDSAQSMQPAAAVKTYTFEPGLYYSYIEGENLESPQTIKLKLLGGGTPVEAKGVKPKKCHLWMEDADIFESYADEGVFDIENNQFTVNENGFYLVCVKDDKGVEWFEWVKFHNMQEPEPELYFDSAYYNEGDEAYLYVRLKDQNSNAEITEMGIVNYKSELLPGSYYNSNTEENNILKDAIPVKVGDTITVTEPGTYTLVVKDSWGNTGLCGIVINDINHDCLRTDSNDSRYQITYDPEDK